MGKNQPKSDDAKAKALLIKRGFNLVSTQL